LEDDFGFKYEAQYSRSEEPESRDDIMVWRGFRRTVENTINDYQVADKGDQITLSSEK
jgi:hypothetical protein